MSLDISLHRKNVVIDDLEVYSANITHNLGAMAEAAGIYGIVWRPEDNGIEAARQLIPPLERAITDMRAHPDRYRTLDDPDGWGLYENFLPWLEGLLEACRENPEATVYASR